MPDDQTHSRMPDDQKLVQKLSFMFARKMLHKAESLHVADARRVSQEATDGNLSRVTSVCRDIVGVSSFRSRQSVAVARP